MTKAVEDALLPGLPVELICAAYANAPGNELESGKFTSPESSAALAANTFGLFLDRPGDLPQLPGTERWGWPALSVRLEAMMRFPWRGGRHPWLDALVETPAALIGIESKRYEPFRAKQSATLSEAYWRPVWGNAMTSFERVRDGLRARTLAFQHLDAAQLVKHAFGLRTAVHRESQFQGKRPFLYYLYAEPKSWPDGRPVPAAHVKAHRSEIGRFAEAVSGDEVTFRFCCYGDLLREWQRHARTIRDHATAVRKRFSP